MGKKEWMQEVVRSAWKEYQAFQRLMLCKSKGSLWEECGEIHFYRSIMEYFQTGSGEYHRSWEVLKGITLPIRAMWNCYLKYEGLEYITREGIEEILQQMGEEEV